MLGALALASPALAQDPMPSRDAYRINPGDVLQITVWKEEDLQRDLLVNPEGHFAFPLYHMVNANFDYEKAGVRTDTFRKAVTAEGFQVFGYIPAPIPTWPRMNWQGYDGPPAPWLRWVKQAKADYRDLRFPHCEWKIAHEVEFGFNYLTVEPRRMQAFADCLLKVEENLSALREWERQVKDLIHLAEMVDSLALEDAANPSTALPGNAP